MSHDIHSLFLLTQNKILQDFSDSVVAERLTVLKAEVRSPENMGLGFGRDHYRRFAGIPAYYDHNQRAVFLNEKAIERTNERTLAIICYHELIHGASFHQNYHHDQTTNVFQSGVKIERYRNKRYACYNRSLNEGIVQFFTNQHNGAEDHHYAYPYETAIVRKLSHKVGIKPLKQALIYNHYELFVAAFHELFGEGSFFQFSRALDRRHYTEAQAIVEHGWVA